MHQLAELETPPPLQPLNLNIFYQVTKQQVLSRKTRLIFDGIYDVVGRCASFFG